MRPTVVLSWGMGVESTAILVRWILEPSTRPCPLTDLIILTAQTGDEYLDTAAAAERHILPLLCQHQIRLVQVARHGHLESDGITLLDDSRSPHTLCLAGDYTLSQELQASGVVPQYGAEHLCSMKFKASPIQRWLDANLHPPPQLNIWHPNFATAAPPSTTAGERMAFGFNADEGRRATRRKHYDTRTRTGFFPLIEWGWTREDCQRYLDRVLGTRWKKSCCVFCPFSKVTGNLLARQRAHPIQVGQALLIEHLSLALNPRGSLYPHRTLLEITEQADNREALVTFEARLASFPWAVYRVRRFYTAKGKAQRTIERIRTVSTEIQAQGELEAIALAGHPSIEWICRTPHARFARRQDHHYPTREGYYVIAPALVHTKAPFGLPRFNQDWGAVRRPHLTARPHWDLDIAPALSSGIR